MITAVDFFCGMGGSSTGLVGAGIDVKVYGNLGEQQMQAGNAVAVNVAHWLGQAAVAALDGRAAA